MKLKRELFSKEPYGGGTLYKYTCNGQDFFLLAEGVRNNRKIAVFKGSTADRADEFTTQSTLQGWAKFEEYLAACQSEQQKKQPQNQNPDENPNVTPMLAIRNTGGNYVVRFFVVGGNGEQTTLMEFALPSNAIPTPYPQNVFNVDWSGEEIPAIFKCEVLLSPNPDVVYAEDENSDVFLFIPKALMSQGGEPQGGSGGEGGEPEPEGDGEPQGGEGDGEPQGGEGGGEPQGGEGDGEPQGGNNKSGNGGNQRQLDMSINSVVQTIADTTGLPANVVQNKFFNVSRGENFLTSSGFENIKNALNLPADTTPRELAEQIINLK